jgi:hypothetical protein
MLSIVQGARRSREPLSHPFATRRARLCCPRMSMGRSIRVSFVLFPFALASACGAPAPGLVVDGGWKGTYECGADSKKASLIFDEDVEGVVSGEAFLDYQVVILGTPILLTGRGVVDGARDEDGGYDGNIDILDNSQGLPDFDFTLALNEQADEVSGVFQIKDGDGQVAQSCDVTADRTDVAN